MFRSPQVVLFSADVERAADFYRALGFNEVFRTPDDGDPIHVDLVLDGYRIGIASVDSTREHHGIDALEEGKRAAVILWTDDVPEALAAIAELGAPVLAQPDEWLGRLLIAWVADPDGHPVQIVQDLRSATTA
jgi:catechol 2,3-dioxygenase-like lactoylglutathione lyase family enzyme